MKLNSGHVEMAIRRHVNPFQVTLIPECVVRCSRGLRTIEYGPNIRPYEYEHFDEYRADFITISTSDYATEIEVKVSRSDWKADADKPKWSGLPDYITRFIYCVPEELGIPDFVPDFAGIWHIRPAHDGGLRIVTVRAPRRIGKEKVPPKVKAKWLSVFYHRFWHQRISLSNRIPKMQRQDAA
jgi:hypothetical protein